MVWVFLLLALMGAGVAAFFAAQQFTDSRSAERAPAGDLPVRRLDVSIALPAAPQPRTVEQLREEADRVAAELIERYPQSPGALHIAATHHSELQQYAKAEELWEQAVRLAPEYAGPRVGLAMAAMARGDDAHAVSVLEQASAAGCRTPELFQQLAVALQKIGRIEEAESAARQGVEAFPHDDELWVMLGQIQLQLNRFDEARTSFREALRREPDSTAAHFALAAVSARLGDAEEAARSRRRFEELRSKNPLERRRFQVVYEALLRRLVVTTLCSAAAEHRRQGDAQEAERRYLRALALNPNAPDTCRWLASFYQSLGRIGDAYVVQQHLAELEPERVENLLNLASLAAEMGRDDVAENALLAAARAAPDEDDAYLGLARLCLRRGESERARVFAQKAIQAAPSADGYLALAAACEQQGDVAGAQAALRQARSAANARGQGSGVTSQGSGGQESEIGVNMGRLTPDP